MADARSGSDVRDRLNALDLASYPPFVLCAVVPSPPVFTFTWDGHALAAAPVDDAHMPITTSSFDPVAVVENRRRILAALREESGLTRETLTHYHAQYDPSRGAYSVCMSRDDAATVSFTHVTVSPQQVRLRYLPAPPCRPQDLPSVVVTSPRSDADS